ncbi:hypothetical protein [Mycoplasma hafezii]|uniref:hypothetical protein n=1 Tax=Mycoplasma hafezii TaxID=525886 RepID=UPI003CFA245C
MKKGYWRNKMMKVKQRYKWLGALLTAATVATPLVSISCVKQEESNQQTELIELIKTKQLQYSNKIKSSVEYTKAEIDNINNFIDGVNTYLDDDKKLQIKFTTDTLPIYKLEPLKDILSSLKYILEIFKAGEYKNHGLSPQALEYKQNRLMYVDVLNYIFSKHQLLTNQDFWNYENIQEQWIQANIINNFLVLLRQYRYVDNDSTMSNPYPILENSKSQDEEISTIAELANKYKNINDKERILQIFQNSKINNYYQILDNSLVEELEPLSYQNVLTVSLKDSSKEVLQTNKNLNEDLRNFARNLYEYNNNYSNEYNFKKGLKVYWPFLAYYVQDEIPSDNNAIDLFWNDEYEYDSDKIKNNLINKKDNDFDIQEIRVKRVDLNEEFAKKYAEHNSTFFDNLYQMAILQEIMKPREFSWESKKDVDAEKLREELNDVFSYLMNELNDIRNVNLYEIEVDVNTAHQAYLDNLKLKYDDHFIKGFELKNELTSNIVFSKLLAASNDQNSFREVFDNYLRLYYPIFKEISNGILTKSNDTNKEIEIGLDIKSKIDDLLKDDYIKQNLMIKKVKKTTIMTKKFYVATSYFNSQDFPSLKFVYLDSNIYQIKGIQDESYSSDYIYDLQFIKQSNPKLYEAIVMKLKKLKTYYWNE